METIKWSHFVKVEKVTSPYGLRTINGKQHFHEGTDYTSLGNKYAMSPCTCIIEKIINPDSSYPYHFKWTNSNGWVLNTSIPEGRAWTPYVILRAEHDKNLKFIYRHGKIRNHYGENNKIEAGEEFYEIGNYGYSMGDHLHVEVLIDNKSTDADVFIKQKLNNILGGRVK